MSTSSNIKKPLSVVKPEPSDELGTTNVETLPESANETEAVSDTETVNDTGPDSVTTNDSMPDTEIVNDATSEKVTATVNDASSKTAETAANSATSVTATANDAEHEVEAEFDLDSPRSLSQPRAHLAGI